MLAGCGAVAPEAPAAADAGSDAVIEVDAGHPLAAPAERTFADLRRRDGGARFTLLIEVWPRARADASCLPPPDVDSNMMILGIVDWDGTPGTFPLGVMTEHGRATVAVGFEEARGSLTVEAFSPKPKYVTYSTDLRGNGTLDISRCGNLDGL